MNKKVVIVGAVAAGASLAARLRRLDENAQITLLEKDGYISFANCGMPYYLGGVIQERAELILNSPQSMKDRFNLDVRTLSEVISIDIKNKLVKVKAQGREYDEPYDVLALCPGANPIKLSDKPLKRLLTLRNIADMDELRAALVNANKVAVIGAGFIGLEMAENLKENGFDVTVIEAGSHVLPPFDEDMAGYISNELVTNDIKLILGRAVRGVDEHGEGIILTLDNDERISFDMAICAIGARPATGFLKDSGIALNERGYIITDEHMRTNNPDVYAAGDAVQVVDFISQRAGAVALAGPANRQGRVAADNIAGIDTEYKGAQGTAIIKLFSLCAAITGKSEKALAGEACHVVYTHPFSHATYYPGAAQMAAKLVFGGDGKILGCQMVGESGVDKRIDVISTAMRFGAKVGELTHLELAYAPPFSMAKDPVNILGYIGENVLNGVTRLITPKEIKSAKKGGFTLLDVRTKAEYDRGNVEGSVHIPLDELRQRLDELDKQKPVYAYCRVGARSHIAQRILIQNGFDAKSVTGGYLTLKSLNM